MSDFIQSFIARLKEEKKTEKIMSKGKMPMDDTMSRDKMSKDDIIRTHKDIIEMKPSKKIVREFFRQSVELMNEDKE